MLHIVPLPQLQSLFLTDSHPHAVVFFRSAGRPTARLSAPSAPHVSWIAAESFLPAKSDQAWLLAVDLSHACVLKSAFPHLDAVSRNSCLCHACNPTHHLNAAEISASFWLTDTNSTAQGGGGSFKDHKPIGSVGLLSCRKWLWIITHWDWIKILWNHQTVFP